MPYVRYVSLGHKENLKKSVEGWLSRKRNGSENRIEVKAGEEGGRGRR